MKSETQSSWNESYSPWFLLLVCVFITSLLTSNIIAVKIISVSNLILPAAIIIFPISYIVGDVLTEVYGYSRARKVIWLGFLCNTFLVLFIWIASLLPPAPFWKAQDAYNTILGYTPRLLFASFLAYLVGEFTNSFVLSKMKIRTKGRFLWARTIGSTLVGQGLDSLLFISIAFLGSIPSGSLIRMIIIQWLTKCIYEAIATPFTYMAVGFLKRKEERDVFDYGTRFNPLLLTQ